MNLGLLEILKAPAKKLLCHYNVRTRSLMSPTMNCSPTLPRIGLIERSGGGRRLTAFGRGRPL